MKKIRYLVEFIIIKLLQWALTPYPIAVSSLICAKIASAIGSLLSVTQIAKKNIKIIFPEKSEKEVDNIILQVWDNLGRVFAEFFYLHKINHQEFQKNNIINGYDNLKVIEENGGIIMSAHLANWEIIPLILQNTNKEIIAVYRKANNPFVDKMIINLRKELNVKLAPKGKNGAKIIIEALKKKSIVIMLLDQKMNDGISVDFLGYPAMSAPAIANLAVKYNVPIIPLQIIRIKNFHFKISIEEPLNIKNKSTLQIMKMINERIGSWIIQNPGQWFWLHKRWPKSFIQ